MIKFRGEKNRCRLFASSTKHHIRHLHLVVMQKRQQTVQKKCDARTKLLFCLFNLLLTFWTFSLPSPRRTTNYPTKKIQEISIIRISSSVSEHSVVETIKLAHFCITSLKQYPAQLICCQSIQKLTF